MRLLVIETATARCSIALVEEGTVIASDASVVGRGHAERLMPMIAALPEGGRADAIWVDCGPGSFTGIRVGIAAARGLAFGWGVPVYGFSSLTIIAAEWFARNDVSEVTVVIEGGHSEVFMQPFANDPLRPTAELQSVLPEAAIFHGPLAGNAAHRLSPTISDDGGPDAINARLLASADLPVRPIYGRAPDAKPLARAIAAT